VKINALKQTKLLYQNKRCQDWYRRITDYFINIVIHL